MNFSNFLIKPEKKRKKRLFDDRPFNSIIRVDESKQRLVSDARTGHWVSCTRVRAESVSDSDDEDMRLTHDYQFKSFNHYFVDEPIYSEPDLKQVMSESYDNEVSPAYDMLTITQGLYHCRVSSTDSDYESFSLDRVDIETSPTGRSRQLDKGALNLSTLFLGAQKK